MPLVQSDVDTILSALAHFEGCNMDRADSGCAALAKLQSCLGETDDWLLSKRDAVRPARERSTAQHSAKPCGHAA